MSDSCKISALFKQARAADKRLYEWMKSHREELLCELGTDRIRWDPLMSVIDTLGLVDERGRRPTLDTAFRTWRRVRSEFTRAERASKTPPLLIGEIARGVRTLVKRDEAKNRHDDSTQRRNLEIRPAVPRMPHVMAQPAVTAGAEGEINRDHEIEGRHRNAGKLIDDVFDAIGSTRTPMPKIFR